MDYCRQTKNYNDYVKVIICYNKHSYAYLIINSQSIKSQFLHTEALKHAIDARFYDFLAECFQGQTESFVLYILTPPCNTSAHRYVSR